PSARWTAASASTWPRSGTCAASRPPVEPRGRTTAARSGRRPGRTPLPTRRPSPRRRCGSCSRSSRRPTGRWSPSACRGTRSPRSPIRSARPRGPSTASGRASASPLPGSSAWPPECPGFTESPPPPGRYPVSPACRPAPTRTMPHPIRAAIVLGLLAGAAVLAGCTRKTPDPVKTTPPVVTVTTPVSRPVTDYEDFTGRMEPYKMVELKSRVTGHLEGVFFKDGQDVAEGKLLFTIDERIYKAEFERADAALTKAEKHQATMKANYDRVKLSYDKGIAGKEAFDIAVGELAEAEADVKSATAARGLAETNLKFTRIYAPFDGRMSKRL